MRTFVIVAAAAPLLVGATAEKPLVPFKFDEYDTQYYKITVKRWQLAGLNDDGVSGPFAVMDENNYVFVSRCGDVTRLTRDRDFITTKGQGAIPAPASAPIACDFQGGLGGVKGLAVDVPKSTAYLQYHFRGPTEGCLKVAVVKYRFSAGTFSDPKLIFETNPCYDEKIAALTQAGGGMSIDSKGTLFFGVGDFGGMDNAQSPDYAHGKIYSYTPATAKINTVAVGTRNPQGLSWAGDVLYESDHGPKGGDEINIVAQGDNLGWPLDSYGAAYNRDVYDEDPADVGYTWGRAKTGKAPAFSFVPSIAPTSIAVYPNDRHFRLWGDDLIVAAIGARSIYRIRMQDGHGVYAEPLANLGDRVRFMQISPAGSIIVKADPNILIEIRRSARPAMTGVAVAYTEEQVARGKRTYSDQCASCHGGSLEGATGGVRIVAALNRRHGRAHQGHAPDRAWLANQSAICRHLGLYPEIELPPVKRQGRDDGRNCVRRDRPAGYARQVLLSTSGAPVRSAQGRADIFPPLRWRGHRA